MLLIVPPQGLGASKGPLPHVIVVMIFPKGGKDGGGEGGGEEGGRGGGGGEIMDGWLSFSPTTSPAFVFATLSATCSIVPPTRS